MSDMIKLHLTPIAGVAVCNRRAITDLRGVFERLYCGSELEAVLGDRRLAQINLSTTLRRGTIRGLHFQRSPHTEDKVVTCLSGAVFDVAVDLREGSPTYLQWHGQVLEEGDHQSLIIPRGCAHGYQALRDRCQLLYLHTSAFAPEFEGGLDALDPAISIAWPLDIDERSERDRSHPLITTGFKALEP